MASVCDEVKAVLLRYAPIKREPTDDMDLRDVDTGLGYSDHGLELLSIPLSRIVFNHGGGEGLSGAEVAACATVADVCKLVEGKIAGGAAAGVTPRKPKAKSKAKRKAKPKAKKPVKPKKRPRKSR